MNCPYRLAYVQFDLRCGYFVLKLNAHREHGSHSRQVVRFELTLLGLECAMNLFVMEN